METNENEHEPSGGVASETDPDAMVVERDEAYGAVEVRWRGSTYLAMVRYHHRGAPNRGGGEAADDRPLYVVNVDQARRNGRFSAFRGVLDGADPSVVLYAGSAAYARRTAASAREFVLAFARFAPSLKVVAEVKERLVGGKVCEACGNSTDVPGAPRDSCASVRVRLARERAREEFSARRKESSGALYLARTEAQAALSAALRDEDAARGDVVAAARQAVLTRASGCGVDEAMAALGSACGALSETERAREAAREALRRAIDAIDAAERGAGAEERAFEASLAAIADDRLGADAETV